MIYPTQDHIALKDIRNDLVILKNGDIALILQTSAVNFGLLSEKEQVAIISAFAGLLNSLSFSIQIVIRSKHLNISSYLELLDHARAKQSNPLLSQMMLRYRNFIEQTIRENEVLDKKFYVIIALGSLEVGFMKDLDERLHKAVTLLKPRRDHIIRQLASIGLQAKQLTSSELLQLFYEVYNQEALSPDAHQQISTQQATQKAALQTPPPVTRAMPSQPISQPPQSPSPDQATPNQEQTPFGPPIPVMPQPHPQIIFSSSDPSAQSISDTSSNQPAQPLKLIDIDLNHSENPFIVEELKDEYHAT